MRFHLLLAIAALSALFMLGVAAPADACEEHKAGLPPSAASDGPIAEMMRATKGMTRQEQIRYIRTLSPEERKALRQELQSLPAEERIAFTKARGEAFGKAKEQPDASAGN